MGGEKQEEEVGIEGKEAEKEDGEEEEGWFNITYCSSYILYIGKVSLLKNFRGCQ